MNPTSLAVSVTGSLVDKSRLCVITKKHWKAGGFCWKFTITAYLFPLSGFLWLSFFGDGCGGKAVHFGNRFIEKAPESYNCFIPMPFEKSAKVVLINETDYDFENYSFVEYTQLPEWDNSLGYFHATWERTAFQLNTQTKLPALFISGNGHLLGRSYSICTDEPFF